MQTTPSGYQAYLLRLWQADGNNSPGWHASLQAATTDQRIGFACLEELFAFLLHQVEAEGANVAAQTHTAEPQEIRVI